MNVRQQGGTEQAHRTTTARLVALLALLLACGTGRAAVIMQDGCESTSGWTKRNAGGADLSISTTHYEGTYSFKGGRV
jgi:hypothetical protein